MSQPFECIAAARFAADGTTNGAGFFAKGCAIARTGAGRYTLTLDNGPNVGEADSTECVVLFTSETAAIVANFVTHTSDSVKTLSSDAAAAAATDTIGQVAVFRVRNPLGG